ncbi:MAG TPA: hypothetical protein VFQ00_01060 [Terriglobales bacterium]|nr:hypothetical protein [Terriglobales bacterium]
MDTVRSLQHLHAAYILTWCVQIGYVLYLLRGFLQLKRDISDLKR